jgi:transcription elongation factor Elf1
MKLKLEQLTCPSCGHTELHKERVVIQNDLEVVVHFTCKNCREYFALVIYSSEKTMWLSWDIPQ